MRIHLKLAALAGAVFAAVGLASLASAQNSPLVLTTNNARATCTDFNFSSNTLIANPLKGGIETFEWTFENPLIPGDNVALKVELTETTVNKKTVQIDWKSVPVADPDDLAAAERKMKVPAIFAKGGNSAIYIYSLGPGSGSFFGTIADVGGINELEFCVFEQTAALTACPAPIELALRDLALVDPDPTIPNPLAPSNVDNPEFLGAWAVVQNVSSAFGSPIKSNDELGPALCLGAGLNAPRPCINEGGVENACNKNLGPNDEFNNQASQSVSRHGENSTNVWCTTGANGRELCFDLTTGQLIN